MANLRLHQLTSAFFFFTFYFFGDYKMDLRRIGLLFVNKMEGRFEDLVI